MDDLKKFESMVAFSNQQSAASRSDCMKIQQEIKEKAMARRKDK